MIVSSDDTSTERLAEWFRWPLMQAVQARTVDPLSSDLVARSSPRLGQGVGVTCEALERARVSLTRAAAR